ncbi:MAG: transposase, partial [Bacteroidales bacterium]|nr:transposase [Bacteroidales bacterium]
PQSRCGKAIVYTFTLLPRLTSYVNDGRIHIDNNLIENAIRPLALGRKTGCSVEMMQLHTEQQLYTL